MVCAWLQEGSATGDCVMGKDELAWFISVVFFIYIQISLGKNRPLDKFAISSSLFVHYSPLQFGQYSHNMYWLTWFVYERQVNLILGLSEGLGYRLISSAYQS